MPTFTRHSGIPGVIQRCRAEVCSPAEDCTSHAWAWRAEQATLGGQRVRIGRGGYATAADAAAAKIAATRGPLPAQFEPEEHVCSGRWDCRPCVRGQRRATHARDRLFVIHAFGGRCAHRPCGEWRQPFITVDHALGDGAAHRDELGGVNIYVWLRRLGCPQVVACEAHGEHRFQLLCRNCQTTPKNRRCPCEQEIPA